MTRIATLLTAVVMFAVVACSLDSVGPVDENDPPPTPEPGIDAGPQFLCYTEYAAAGDVSHAVDPSGTACMMSADCPNGEVCFQQACELERCDGNGEWTITFTNPQAGEGETACSDAPATLTLTLDVAVVERNATAVDQDDASRTWEGQMADKGGSCSGTFTFTEPDGVTSWSIHAVEDGPDGPLAGKAHYEVTN
jgi:hypothetical protein